MGKFQMECRHLHFFVLEKKTFYQFKYIGFIQWKSDAKNMHIG